MPKSIPDRWEDYSNIGEVIEGTQFVTFKVPLKETIQVPENLKFTPSMLTDTLESRQVQLKLVIDLTNTERYYNRQEFENKSIGYSKIFVPGHVVPAEDIFNRFARTVDSFLEENTDKDSVVGVHCTHGVNRTGYMVCRYMIEKLGFEPSMAINAYNTARGYPIERENYLKDLNMRKAGKCSGRLTYEPQGAGGSRQSKNHHRHRNRQRNDRYQQNGYHGNSYNSQYMEGQNHSYSACGGDQRHERRNNQWGYDKYSSQGYQNLNHQMYESPPYRPQHHRRREPACYPVEGNKWSQYSCDSYNSYARNKDQGHRRLPYSRQNSKSSQ